MAHIFGVDIGGTKIAVAAVSLRGEILARTEIETRAAEGAPRVVARLCDALHSLQREDELLGIGIGCTGPVDPRTGHVRNPYTLPTWDDVDIVSPLAQEFHTRVVLENDCDVAALGEHWMGNARGADNAVYITVGTGIGAGLIFNNKLYRGVGMTAGEIGHMTIEHDGVPCYCGARGCLEMLAAGPAIARAYEIKTGAPNITAREVMERARRGDANAHAVIEQTAYYLGVGLANLITLLVPNMIVLGGGVMQHFDLFYPTMRATITKNATLVPSTQVKIVPAALGQNAGVIGAAKALLERMDNE
jgi:glucokinase